MGKAFGHSSEKNRNKNDYYPTPYSMTKQLLQNYPLDTHWNYYDPATGEAEAIEKVFKENGLKIAGNDIINGANLLQDKREYDFIVTNPPYNLADEFVEKARENSKHGFAMLLRTNFLSGQKRFEAGRFENLKRVMIFTRMPDLNSELREDGKYRTAMIVYAWFVWEHSYSGNPEISWIDNQKFVLKKCEEGE